MATFALIAVTTSAQWECSQVVQSNSPEPEWGHVVRYCPDSGLVATGQWREEARFGGITFTGVAPAQMNAFLVRYGTDGVAAWAHAFRSSETDRAVLIHGLATDADGNIIVGGNCPDTLLMDETPLTYDAGGAGNIDAWFIAKFDAGGNLLWAVDKESTVSGAEIWDLAVDPVGDIWACGSISTSYNRLVKFSGDDGAVLYESDDVPGRMARVEACADGSVLLHGKSVSTFTFDDLICPVSGVLGGASTSWTIKLDETATAQWYYAPEQGTSGYPSWGALNLAATADGQAYVLAQPKTRIQGDTIALSSGQHGLYKLDADGAPVWWKRFNVSGIVEVHDMAATPDGGCWLVGDMNGNCDLIDTVVTHQGLFAFRYDADGNVVQRIFGPAVEDTWSVDVRENEIVVAGTQAGTMQFGDQTITDNWFGLFAARYGPAVGIGIRENGEGMEVRLFPNPASGRVYLRTSTPGPLEVEVLNSLGQRVLHMGRFNAVQDVVDLRGLPEGVLLVNVSSAVARTALRVVHQH